MDKKPNIIIINPDEMRWDTMGHMGNPAEIGIALWQYASDGIVAGVSTGVDMNLDLAGALN